MPLHIDMRKERSITIIRLVGSISNQDGATELRSCLLQCMGEGEWKLLLEAHDVTHMDEAGVDTLQQSQAEARKAGGDLKISGARYNFLAVLAIYTSRAAFPYYAESEHALESFKGTSGPRHFDILEFVQEQEAEEEKNASSGFFDQDSKDPA